MKLYDLVQEWQSARQLAMEYVVKDVRKDEQYRWVLDRLAKAEQALFNYERSEAQ